MDLVELYATTNTLINTQTMPLLPSQANLKTTKRQQGSMISNCLFNTCTLSMELLTKRKYQLSHLEVSQTILGLVLGLIQTFKM